LEFTAQQLALLSVLLLATGAVAGLLAGLLGVGGGIVIVPVLYHVFAQHGIDPAVRMHVAVGTSLASIVVTAFRSVRSHHAHGAVDVALLRRWVVGVAAGVLLGTWIAGELSGSLLTAVFASVALGVALYMAFGSEQWRLRAEPPVGAARFAVGGGIGFVSVLMGLGGGTLGVPTLTLLGVPIHRAVGTAAGLGLVIAIPGVIGFLLSGQGVPGRPPLSVGYVNAVGFASIVPATWLAAPLGARLAHRISRVALRRAFAAFLGATSLRMLVELA